MLSLALTQAAAFAEPVSSAGADNEISSGLHFCAELRKLQSFHWRLCKPEGHADRMRSCPH